MKRTIACGIVLTFVSQLSAQAQQPNPDAVPWGIASSASAWRNHGEWFPKMTEAGASWVRLFPEWRSIEPVAK